MRQLTSKQRSSTDRQQVQKVKTTQNSHGRKIILLQKYL